MLSSVHVTVRDLHLILWDGRRMATLYADQGTCIAVSLSIYGVTPTGVTPAAFTG